MTGAAAADAPDEPGVMSAIAKPALIAGAVIAVFVAVFAGWGATAPISGGAIATGRISPEGSRRTVQHLEGGIIESFEVSDGGFEVDIQLRRDMVDQFEEFWGDLDTPYSIEYVNGQSARGTWDLVMQGTPTSANFGVAADGPYEKTGLYDVTVRLLYRTDDVTYKTEMTVAPGEPDG